MFESDTDTCHSKVDKIFVRKVSRKVHVQAARDECADSCRSVRASVQVEALPG